MTKTKITPLYEGLSRDDELNGESNSIKENSVAGRLCTPVFRPTKGDKKTEGFIRKNIAGRKSKMARGRRKQLERMEKMEALDQKEITPYFHFPSTPFTNMEHLFVKHLSVGYHYSVLSDIGFTIKGGQKVVITGFNGIGKSTLLKTLIGEIPSMNGHYKFSDQVTIGYFEQDLLWNDTTRIPIQIISDNYPEMVMKEVRKSLARCGISSKHAMQPIETLSGGEQAKVKMCLLTLKPCNFLILDEPTNHLDVHATFCISCCS